MRSDLADNILSRLGNRSSFVDARIQEGEDLEIRITPSCVKIRSLLINGMGTRILMGNEWYHSSSQGLENIEVINILEEMTRFSSTPQRSKVKFEDIPVTQKKLHRRARRRPSSMENADKLAELKAINQDLQGAELDEYEIVYADFDRSTLLVNSLGTNLEIPECYATIALKGTINQNGTRIPLTASIGGCGLEYVFNDALYSMTRSFIDKVNSFVRNPKFERNRIPIIFSSRMSGILCHEAVGHLSEADYLINGTSLFKGKIGKRLCPNHVTVIDDPMHPNSCYPYEFDHDGIPARRTTIVDRGILTSHINDLMTSLSSGLQPNGHGRSPGFMFPPMPRSANIFFQPGDISLDETMGGLKTAIYAEDSKQCSVDVKTGNIVFDDVHGWLISNGGYKGFTAGLRISGKVQDILGSIESIGSDLDFACSPCVKYGQTVPVSHGGPHLMIRGGLRVDCS